MAQPVAETSSVRVSLNTPTTTTRPAAPTAPVADKPSAYSANRAAWNAFYEIDRQRRLALNAG